MGRDRQREERITKLIGAMIIRHRSIPHHPPPAPRPRPRDPYILPVCPQDEARHTRPAEDLLQGTRVIWQLGLSAAGLLRNLYLPTVWRRLD